MSRRFRLACVIGLAMAFTGAASAQTPSHPLSHIKPTDTNLDFSNNPSGKGFNITGLPAIDPAGQQLMLLGNLDMQGNDIVNYFAAQCGPDRAVRKVFANGSYRCGSALGDGLPEVLGIDNSAGTHNISMNGNHITDLAAPTSSSDAMTKGYADQAYVFRSGDTMTGNLDMLGNDILNLDEIGNGSASLAVTSTLNLRANRLTNIGSSSTNFQSDGDLDLTGSTLINPGSITSYFDASPCSGENVVQDVNDDGTFKCANVGGIIEDRFVNETGDTMTGNLSMNSNAVTGVSTFTGDSSSAVSVGAGDTRYVQRAGDTMTGNLDMGAGGDDSIVNVDQIGIGVGAPAQDLHIQKTNEPMVRLENTNNRTYDIFSGGGGSSSYWNDFVVYDRTGGGHRLVINQNGNVGIGPANPDAGLDLTAGALDMNTNTIQNPGTITSYFDASPCSGQSVVQDVNDDGTFDCINVAGEVEGAYVNETGDTMAGTLDMSTNDIQNVQQFHALRGGFASSPSAVQSVVGSSGHNFYVADNITVDGEIIGGGADVAERINTEGGLEEGSVAVISGNMTVAPATKRYDTTVAGVISTDPGVVLARKRDGRPLALTGTVPVKVSVENGDIKPGDLLTTSSTRGRAMKCQDRSRCQGAIIGKALQAANTNTKIKALVTLG